MRSALALLVLFLPIGHAPVSAETWIGLWQVGDEFLGMTTGGDVDRYIPPISVTQCAGSMGSGPWVSFGRVDERIPALRPDGQIWAMDVSTGTANLYRTLPPDREWCSPQYPEDGSSYAISCDGEIWNLYEPAQTRADFGPSVPGRWICVATVDDSLRATLESGDTVQGTWEWCDPAGTYVAQGRGSDSPEPTGRAPRSSP